MCPVDKMDPLSCETSAEDYLEAALAGHASAQCSLGMCYGNGYGVDKDWSQAVAWYRKAAEQGHALAQKNLGVCYAKGLSVPQDFTHAVEWYKKSAAQGDAGALHNLGVCYAHGLSCDQDYALAVDCYTRAAAQGHAAALFYLGDCYFKGLGVTADPARAAEAFRGAAEQGHAAAQFKYGECLLRGAGTPADAAAANEWFHKSGELGHMPAQAALGACYAKGVGVPQDWGRAAMWMRKAGDRGHAASQRDLGVCYAKGEGVHADTHKAMEWYRKAAEQGDPQGQYLLGAALCARSVGGASPNAEGVEWLEKAAAQRDPHAVSMLSLIMPMSSPTRIRDVEPASEPKAEEVAEEAVRAITFDAPTSPLAADASHGITSHRVAPEGSPARPTDPASPAASPARAATPPASPPASPSPELSEEDFGRKLAALESSVERLLCRSAGSDARGAKLQLSLEAALAEIQGHMARQDELVQGNTERLSGLESSVKETSDQLAAWTSTLAAERAGAEEQLGGLRSTLLSSLEEMRQGLDGHVGVLRAEVGAAKEAVAHVGAGALGEGRRMQALEGRMEALELGGRASSSPRADPELAGKLSVLEAHVDSSHNDTVSRVEEVAERIQALEGHLVAAAGVIESSVHVTREVLAANLSDEADDKLGRMEARMSEAAGALRESVQGTAGVAAGLAAAEERQAALVQAGTRLEALEAGLNGASARIDGLVANGGGAAGAALAAAEAAAAAAAAAMRIDALEGAVGAGVNGLSEHVARLETTVAEAGAARAGAEHALDARISKVAEQVEGAEHALDARISKVAEQVEGDGTSHREEMQAMRAELGALLGAAASTGEMEALREELGALQDGTAEEVRAVRAELASVRAGTEEQVGALRSTLLSSLEEMRQGLDGHVGVLRAEVGAAKEAAGGAASTEEVAALRAEVGAAMKAAEGHVGVLRGELGAARAGMDGQVAALREEFGAARAGAEDSLGEVKGQLLEMVERGAEAQGRNLMAIHEQLRDSTENSRRGAEITQTAFTSYDARMATMEAQIGSAVAMLSGAVAAGKAVMEAKEGFDARLSRLEATFGEGGSIDSRIAAAEARAQADHARLALKVREDAEVIASRLDALDVGVEAAAGRAKSLEVSVQGTQATLYEAVSKVQSTVGEMRDSLEDSVVSMGKEVEAVGLGHVELLHRLDRVDSQLRDSKKALAAAGEAGQKAAVIASALDPRLENLDHQVEVVVRKLGGLEGLQAQTASLRETVGSLGGRVEGLLGGVGKLHEAIELDARSAQSRAIAGAAEQRLAALEAMLKRQQGDRLEEMARASKKQTHGLHKLVADMAGRIQMLERSLEAEQEGSLKALEALMSSQGSAPSNGDGGYSNIGSPVPYPTGSVAKARG